MHLLKISWFNSICKRFRNKAVSQNLKELKRINELKSQNTSRDFCDKNYDDSSNDKGGLPQSSFFLPSPPSFDLKLNALFPEATKIFSERTRVDDEKNK